MKKIAFLICLILLFCPSCSTARQNESATTMDQENLDSDAEIEPSWAKGTQIEDRLFQGLNLDGVGNLDDEVYVSIYQFGDFEDKATVLRIHLGTGETLAKILPVYGRYSLQTGKLFSVDKDAIVLEIVNPTSNWGSADIFALDIYPTGIAPTPSVATRLDTTVGSINTVFEDISEDFRAVTDGTQIVDIDGSPLQGLNIYFTGPKGQWRELNKTFLWSDGKWLDESEKVIEINGQTWQIKNDDREIYSCKNDEKKIIHQIKSISTMSFFVTKIKDLSEDVVVVADPQGNAIRNLCIYRYNVEDEEWKRLSIIEAGIALDDDTFYGLARVNEKGNLEFAERIPKRTPTVDEWEFIIYDVTYDAEEEAVKIEENKRLPGGIPLWWNNS